MRRRTFIAGVIGLCTLLPLAARTQDAKDDPPPLDDSDALRDWWERQPEERRDKLRKRFERYKSMPPEKQDRLRRRMERWRQLPPERRGEIRDRWQRFRKLPPERQHRIRKNMKRWRNLGVAHSCLQRG